MYKTSKTIKEILSVAYNLSKPQGMGFLHYVPGPISDKDLVHYTNDSSNKGLYHFDYVNGRAVKLYVEKVKDSNGDYVLHLNDSWFDHTSQDFLTLISKLEASNLNS